MKTLAVLFSLSILLYSALPASAAWPEYGVNLSPNAGGIDRPGIASDGAGGCYAAWADDRNGDYDIFVQRIDGDGNPLWGTGGIAVCVQPLTQATVSVVPDDAGGAYIVWLDDRSGNTDIYAQRVQSDGSMAWQANGMPVCTVVNSQDQLAVATEGAFVLIGWRDSRSIGTSGYDIYAQRLNGSGNPMWASNGVAVCTNAGNQARPEILSDGLAGAVLAWEDWRAGDADVYAHHVNFFGTPDWTSQGVAVASGALDQTEPRLVSDGQGVAVVAWITNTGSNEQVRASRLGPTGLAIWTRTIVNTAVAANLFEVASDGSGGIIMAWVDFRTGSDFDTYAQRVTHAGALLWGEDGVVVSAAPGGQYPASVNGDGEGGAIVTFYEESLGWHVYAQRFDGQGIEQWPSDGVPVVTGPGTSDDVASATASDGAVLIGYESFTGTFMSRVQRIEPRYGYWGKPEPSIVAVDDNPGDQGGQVAVGWGASDRDNLSQQAITHYSLWRATDTLPGSVAAQTTVGKDARSVTLEDIGPDFASAAVREGTINGVEYLWEFVTTQQAIYASGYSDLVATRQDSIGGDPAQHYFQVVAHTANSQIFFPSAPDSGHSVDNLAPAAPLGLAAMRSGGPNVDLDWSPSGMAEADFKEFWVYRGTTSGFPTDPAHFLTSTPDTMSTDTSADTGGMWYYKVLAVDIHDNPSDESNEAFVSPVTGIGDRAPSLTALTVQNYPNPFSGATEIRIGLPAASPVTIAVYDVAGRRVASSDLGVMSAGHQALTFDGRDASGRALPSGVYFYRVTAGAETATRKIVIRR